MGDKTWKYGLFAQRCIFGLVASRRVVLILSTSVIADFVSRFVLNINPKTCPLSKWREPERGVGLDKN